MIKSTALQFNSHSLVAKTILLGERGSFISSRISQDELKMVDLYVLSGYLVEVFYDHTQKLVENIAATEKKNTLDDYTSDIQLPDQLLN